MVSLLRLILGCLLGAAIAHVVILGGALGAGLGGPFAGFAATAMLNGITLATQPNPPAPDALAQALLLVVGPFFSMAGAAVIAVGVVSRIMTLGWLIPVAVTALLSIATLLPRLDGAASGAPAVTVPDLLLAGAAGALGALICRAIAGSGRRRRD